MSSLHTTRRPRCDSTAVWGRLLLAATVAFTATPSRAHDLAATQTLITLGERRFEIIMECDLDALALGAAPTADDAELLAALEAMDEARLADTTADLRQLFARRVRLFAGDTRVAFEVEFPDRDAGRTIGMLPPTFLGLTAQLRGSLPDGSEPLRFRLSRAFPSAQLTVIDANGEILLEELVLRGEDSSTFSRLAGSPSAPRADRSLPRSTSWILGAALAAGFFALTWRRWRGAGGGRDEGSSG